MRQIAVLALKSLDLFLFLVKGPNDPGAVRFSLVAPSTLSSPACTFLNRGIVHIIMPNTTTESAGIVTTKINAAFTSMVKAITMAPNTIKGERRNRRSTIFTPLCT